MGDHGKRLALKPEFTRGLGLFHSVHSSLDLTVDFAICKFLSVTPQHAHLVTSGMMFGPKVRLLSNLVGSSKDQKRNEIMSALRAITGTKRDVVVHGYMWSDETKVRFIERSKSGEFTAKSYEFTLESFILFVYKYNSDANDLYHSVGATYDSIQDFANAVFSLDRKSNKSTGNPASKK